MKTKRKSVGVVLIVMAVIVAGAGVFTQVVRPLTYSFDEAVICTFLDSDSKDIIRSEYESGRQGAPDIQPLSDIDFDFSNPADYAQILVFFDVTSNSILPLDNIEFFVVDLGGTKDRFMFKEDHAVTVSADMGDTETIRLYLGMYVKGLSDDEIAAMVAQLKVEIQYHQILFGERHQKISIPTGLQFAEHRVFTDD